MRVAGGLLLFLLAAAVAACGDDAGSPAPPVDPVALQRAAAEDTGFPVEVGNDLGMRFRLIPPTEFTMGSPPGEAGRGDDEVEHVVTLLMPYYLQTTEVTNAQLRRFRPEHRSGEAEGSASLDGDDQPAVGVSRDDALAFAAWLTEHDPRFAYRLPTESEWEHACRALTATPFACGERLAPTWGTVADGPDGPARATAPVGLRPANAWGLRDLHGNAAEWCHDRYGPYPLWRLDGPQGPAHGEEHVVRGGTWAGPAARARSAARAHARPDARHPTVGFRLAMNLGYGRSEYGKHTVTFRVVDPTVDEGVDGERPGWPLRMGSVHERLTDRMNGIMDDRWVVLAAKSPTTVHLAPGRYYVQTWAMEGDVRLQGVERKFDVPGPDLILLPVPRKFLSHPQ